MGNEYTVELSQDIPFGIMRLTLSDEEVAILKLFSSGDNDPIKYWEQLWKNTKDYEDLLFSCKELMPSAVKKIQTICTEDQWKQFIPKNAQFLTGLPRYTWTKNQYIINEYQKIAALLDKENIEFLALKGVCEMLDGSTLSFMRTSRDIDILIHEEDWLKCKKILNNMGWVQSEKSRKSAFLKSPIKSHAENFKKSERIFDLDVHFVAIPGAKSNSINFTSNLWKRKVKAKEFSTYYIPSLEDRYIITAANVFNLHNWANGHTTKYFYDLLSISSQINNKQLFKIREDAERFMKFGDFVRQAGNFVEIINHNTHEHNGNKYRINLCVSQNFLFQIIRLLHIIQLVNMLNKVSQIIHVITFTTSRVLIKVFYLAKGKLFIQSIKESKKINSKSNIQNQFSIHLFPR
jgi:Uncharacterised nucleotidyltransferase